MPSFTENDHTSRLEHTRLWEDLVRSIGELLGLQDGEEADVVAEKAAGFALVEHTAVNVFLLGVGGEGFEVKGDHAELAVLAVVIEVEKLEGEDVVEGVDEEVPEWWNQWMLTALRRRTDLVSPNLGFELWKPTEH
jgi:hypothetical protein